MGGAASVGSGGVRRAARGARAAACAAVCAALLAACGSAGGGVRHAGSSAGRSTTSTTAAPTSTTQPTTTSSTTSTSTTTTTVAPVTTAAPPATVPPATAPPDFTTVYTKPGPAPPPLAQPTASHPLTVLEIGDSLGIDLGWGLGALFGSDPMVHVIEDAVGDTGLARPDYYDWPVHLAQELAEYHPGVVIVFLGGNDGQGFVDDGQDVEFGTSQWHTVYSERVGNLMNEATGAGARVFWVGMPIMQASYLSGEMSLENQAYSQQAAIHPGVTYYSSWDDFTNSAGQYSQYLPDSSGAEVMVRDPDGVHITYAGADRLADDMLGPMEQAFGVKLAG